jgi:hypothetical protein
LLVSFIGDLERKQAQNKNCTNAQEYS